MKEAEVRKRAFAMPLTSPAYPIGPYRFVNREYLIITYRTDPSKLRAARAGAARDRRAAGQVRVHPHAGFDRLRRLHRERPGHPGLASRAARAATPTACSSTTIRRSPAAASCGAFPRSWPSRRCAPRSTRWSARSTTARSGSPPAPWATSTSRPISPPSRRRCWRRTSCSRSSRMSTARRASASWSSIQLLDVDLKGAWTGPAALTLTSARAGAGRRAAGARGRVRHAHPRRPDARARQGRARLSGVKRARAHLEMEDCPCV